MSFARTKKRRNMKRPIKIGVVGPHACSRQDQALGFAVGAEIARRGGILICGGLGGMMHAAARGAKSENGFTVGILPGDDASDANPFIDLAIPTGLGLLRNGLIVRASDAIVAVRGAYGTLSEIALALGLNVPVIGLNTWTLLRDGNTDPGIMRADNAVDAVEMAFRNARTQTRK